jgi:hypothetical protein
VNFGDLAFSLGFLAVGMLSLRQYRTWKRRRALRRKLRTYTRFYGDNE